MLAEPTWPQGAIVKLRCMNFDQSRTGANSWGALGMSSTLTLHRVSAQRTPILLHDRLLRILVLDRQGNAFIGYRRGRYQYELRIERSASVDDRDADQSEVERARTVLRACELQMEQIHNEVATRARRIYNRRWRFDLDRELISREEVANRMYLRSLTVQRNGEVHVSFADDDMFYGGTIDATLRRNLQIRLVTVNP